MCMTNDYEILLALFCSMWWGIKARLQHSTIQQEPRVTMKLISRWKKQVDGQRVAQL